MNKTKITRHIRFQRAVYKVLVYTLGPVYGHIVKFKYEPYRPKSETFLFLSNHNMDLDAFLAVIVTKRHMRFVANEVILKGFAGKLIGLLAGPIPRKKGAPTEELVDTIMRSLKSGISVGMYPEMERSWDGRTQVISFKTAKIAKESGAGLITYVTNGGYLRAPHWSKSLRDGPLYGSVIHEYSPEELAKMSVQEIYEAICEDLRADAFEFQRHHMYRYTGSDLAENIELACFVCPACESTGQIVSKGDTLRCESCGYSAVYNEYGFLEGKGVIFENTALWSAWQKEWLKENAEELKERTSEPIILNKDISLLYTDNSGETKILAENARSAVYGDRIDIMPENGSAISFMLEDITKLGSYKRSKIMLTCSGKYFTIESASLPVSGYIYYALWRVLTGRSYF